MTRNIFLIFCWDEKNDFKSGHYCKYYIMVALVVVDSCRSFCFQCDKLCKLRSWIVLMKIFRAFSFPLFGDPGTWPTNIRISNYQIYYYLLILYSLFILFSSSSYNTNISKYILKHIPWCLIRGHYLLT